MALRKTPDDWISVADAAQIAGYHEESIRRLIREKKIQARKFVTVWQVSRTSLLAYVRYAALLGNHRGPKDPLDKP
jgi:hypothetical protein